MTLDEIRTLSKLSEQVHFFEENNKKYAVFRNTTVPSNVFNSILIWVLSNSNIHYMLLSNVIDEIKALNEDMKYMSIRTISYTLTTRLRETTANWTEKEYYRLIQEN